MCKVLRPQPGTRLCLSPKWVGMNRGSLSVRGWRGNPEGAVSGVRGTPRQALGCQDEAQELTGGC